MNILVSISLATIALGIFATSAPVFATEPTPVALQGVDVREHLGTKVNLDRTFLRQDGKKVRLRDYFDGEQPVLLTLNYFRCTTLCSVQLNRLLESLKTIELTAGVDGFRIVTVSIDPSDDVVVADGKRTQYLKELGRGESVDWDFLTVVDEDDSEVRALAKDLGYVYRYDEESNQYLHTPVVFVLGPDGTISRYLYGLNYPSRDVKFSLIEAADGRVGSTLDRILLSCFHYDETAGDYTASAFGMMRLGGLLTLAFLGSVLLFYWFRERSRHLVESSP